ncbi:MAG: rRNA ((1402)-N(4))-methyltransferase RsmH [Verrucomicrobiota bacterium]
MLFTPPTLTLEAVRNHAASVAFARVSGLGFLSDAAAGSGQHAVSSIQTDVRTAPGWLSVRRLVIFSLAGRTKSLGTELHALFETMVRAAPGWLSARPSQIFLSDEAAGSGQHAASSIQTDVRTAPGWLSVRRLVTFMAGRVVSLGTELHALFETMGRAASGVLSARPSSDFSSGQSGALGTARRGVGLTDACAAPGWLSAQAPVHFSETAGAGDYHLPVFPAETGEWMAAGPDKFIIDGTLGGGGHSEIFLKSGARVLGVDRDPEALAHARARLAIYGERFSTWEGNFSRLQEIPEIRMGERADGLLMDLGVSSRQLDSAERGFSFMREGPLDMRMGPSSPRTAADIVNQWSEADIVRILFEYGEESSARRIAGAILRHRAVKPFVTTLDLANCIEKAIGRHGRTHPATKTFQAIRMAVNEELESLATALAAAPAALKPGGRLLIITFHSLEDRMVKRFLKHRSTPFLDEPGWPEPRPNPDYQFRLLARKAISPTAEETSLNPRARSAKLRVAQLLDLTP